MHLLEEDLEMEGSGASLLEWGGSGGARVENGKGKMGMIAPWLRDRAGVGGRERVLERAGRVQACRKGHHSPATWGKREECYFSPSPSERGWLWLPCRAKEAGWYGTERTLPGANSPERVFP